MKLSIIIPVYNVEPYLERCLRSLQEQGFPKSQYEVIVTNDGSPDNSRTIVERLQQEYDNIILINQENQGVSMARNNAIARASGKYILPVDPDDFVLPNYLPEIVDWAESNSLDMLYLGFIILDEQERKEWQIAYQQDKQDIINGTEGYFASRIKVRDPDRSWGILFRKHLLDKYQIDYPKDVPFLEDGLFVAKYCLVAQRCSLNDIPFYQRTTRPGSATHSRLIFSKKALQGFINSIKDIIAFSERNQLNEEQSRLVNHIVAKFTFHGLMAAVADRNIKAFRLALSELRANGIDKLNLEGCRYIYYRYAKLYNISPYLFAIYYWLRLQLKQRWNFR